MVRDDVKGCPKTEDEDDENEVKENLVGYFTLYRYATKCDIILIVLGVFFTFVKSLGTPLMIVVYGEFTTLLVDRTYMEGTSSSTYLLHFFGGGKILVNATWEENRIEIINDSISYGILMSLTSILQFVSGIFCVDLFNYTAMKQITRIRVKFFQSLVRQDIGWYDTSTGNNFGVRITEDIDKIREGIAEKVSHFLWLIIGFIICVSLSFYYGWELSLVVISYVPIVIVTNTIISKVQATLTKKEIDAYAFAANLVEEVLGGIRTVVAFCGEKREIERYDRLLVPAQKAGVRKGLSSGVGEGIMRGLFFASNALAYWYGVRLVLNDRDKIDKEYTPAVLMIAFFGLIVGADNIAKTAPYLETFAAARGAATSIFNIIDRKPKIDAMSTGGKVMNFGIKGDIHFNNVVFNYPSRSDVSILRGLTTSITAGETVALVGSSGNGKSTCLHLLQRFYDPLSGEIYIDGHNIKHFNISWLRSNIALVGQEPVLFSTTIAENIRYGNPDATDKEVESAAKDSGAHDFVSKLPDGYNTMVGEKGCQLSGGQKQRIAIARALIQNPKILLLDEATSALDYQSEKFVQETLDKVSKGRTTIVVSHRLSAIRHADRILYIDKGQVVEDGSHEELVDLKGRYFDMVTAVNLEMESEYIASTINENQEQSEKLQSKQLFLDPHHFDNKQEVKFKDDAKSDDVKTEIDRVKYIEVAKRILKISKPEWFSLVIATLSAVCIGSSFPVFAILFAEFYGALSLADADEAISRTNELCILFLFCGLIMFLAALLQTHLLNRAGVFLTSRIRSMTFKSMMVQEMGWFDDDNNSVGALSGRLTGDAANIQGAIGYPFSGIVQSLATFFFGMAVAFAFSWKLSLVCLIFFPPVVYLVLLEAKHMAQLASTEKDSLEGGIKIATEATSNIRTVASLRQEPHIIGRYVREMEKVEHIIRKKIIWRGLVSSSGQAIPFFGYAVTLWYGGLLVADQEIHFKNIIKVSEALLYGTIMFGQSLVFAPAFTAAFVAGHRLFKTIDREPRITSPIISNRSRKPDKKNDLYYKRIEFSYPTRPTVPVLQGLDLTTLEGKTVALVGPSGCGKSTCIQLLQRLYDIENGRLYVGFDEVSSDISLNDLRNKLSIVSQEPVLFDRTIAENIAFGDSSRTVPMSEIIEAAKVANVHNFITSLPAGYETNLGSKGTQLSGGQKQRIAIARALVRNPKILLLDEATSALDLQSEQAVQQALDDARSGRTCLVIAHRLTTVQNADLICVIQNGRVIEQGTHNQLLTQGGFYARLYNSQPIV